MSKTTTEQWLTERQAAEFLQVCKRTVRNYRVTGMLRKWRVRPTGRGFQYSTKELENLLTKPVS